ncbi:MAG: PEP/pyruvate-binding domain-containing protein [Planctomycetota bacterium]
MKMSWAKRQRLAVSIGLALTLPLAVRVVSAQGGPHLPAIRTEADFTQISVSVNAGETLRTTKYLLPVAPKELKVSSDELRAAIFQNVNRYPLHREFLIAEFPEDFPGLSEEAYRELVERRETRSFFAGSLSSLDTADGLVFGFTVFFDFADSNEIPTESEIAAIYDRMLPVVDLRPLAYYPANAQARLAAREWKDPSFPVYLGADSEATYEAYSVAIGYGRVRLLSPEAFEEVSESGRLTWQDLLILEEAPRDIEGVVSGVITAEPQGPLGHLAIRTARRGSPNAFLKDAAEAFREFDGQLVRLEVGRTEYRASVATLDEAQTWWEENRPRLDEAPAIDGSYNRLDQLLEIDLDARPETRFGGKVSGLARLQHILTGEYEAYRENGFGIPIKHYLDFLKNNRMPAADGGLSYEEHLRELLSTPAFESDSEFRFEALKRFREHAREHSTISRGLVTSIIVKSQETFGSTTSMLRCRSSSNTEDSVEFNGAGLYDSTSVCPADSLDLDDDGPSRCGFEVDERQIERALRRVWSSLWNFRAFEERAYFQVDHEDVGMGVLVSRAFRNEQVNGVAFTGNPTNPADRRFVIVAQLGNTPVVSPPPGVVAERNVLTISGGQVESIDRVERSSLANAGELVLSDDQLAELGRVLSHIDTNYPVDLGERDRGEVVLDVEFKITEGGQLAIKQVRPFLLPNSQPSGPEFTLNIPANTVLCGVFADGRFPREELELKSQLRLREGSLALPTATDSFPGELVEEFRFGGAESAAEAEGPGRFELTFRTRNDGSVRYTFRFLQTFRSAQGESLALEIELPYFETQDGKPSPGEQVLDEEAIVRRTRAIAIPNDELNRLVLLSDCEYETIPLWDVRAELADGTSLRLEERFEIPTGGSGPAAVVGATVTIGGEERQVDDYWKLVYAAEHHNVQVKYWVVLDPPITLGGVGEVHAIDLREPQTLPQRDPEATYLGADFRALGSPDVSFYWKGLFGEEPLRGFRRGDVDASGRVDISDPIFVLRHLFLAGPASECPDSVDFDDNNVSDLSDAILMLSFLFRGVDLSGPPGPYECGDDPTDDRLGECTNNGCAT